MQNDWTIFLLYAIPVVIVYTYYLSRRATKQRTNREVFWESIDSGMTSPPSLHPIIDSNKCIGCEACVHACPEFPAHQVLGIIGNKANLVSPTDCIGHGACKEACPVGAISLVFGTAERGIDIPNISPEFETNIPGIFVAGELGGMGLIKNAVEQGRQALECLSSKIEKNNNHLDVAIVGAGPAGFSAALAAHEKKLRYVAFEQSELGGTVANFPRGKLVMTSPAILPIYGEMKFRETQKEALIDFWRGVEKQTGVNIHYKEKILEVKPTDNGFLLTTTKNTYRTAAVLLAIGRRGTPRTLGVEGEKQSKVVYSMIDPSEYADKQVLVVGGGDSALEAANAIAEEPGSVVTLSYRSGSFSRAKRKNRQKSESLAEAGKLNILFNSNVKNISEEKVVIGTKNENLEIGNDAVIVCVGGILPTGFLNEIGIEVETKYGVA